MSSKSRQIKLLAVDPRPKRSIKYVKRQLAGVKRYKHSPDRTELIDYFKSMIDFKQKLYFHTYQHIPGYQWGKSKRVDKRT